MIPGFVSNNFGIIRLGKKSIPIDAPKKMNIAPMLAVTYFIFGSTMRDRSCEARTNGELAEGNERKCRAA